MSNVLRSKLSSTLVQRTQIFWSDRLGREVSEEEAEEMILGAKQLLDLLKCEHNRMKGKDSFQRYEVNNEFITKT